MLRFVSSILALTLTGLATPAMSACRGVTVKEGANLNFGQLRYHSDEKTGWISISPNGAISTSKGLSVSTKSRWRPGTVQLKLPARSETLIRLQPIAVVDRDDELSSLDLEIHSDRATIAKLADDTFSITLDDMGDDRGQPGSVELIVTGTLRLKSFPRWPSQFSHRFQITCLRTTTR